MRLAALAALLAAACGYRVMTGGSGPARLPAFDLALPVNLTTDPQAAGLLLEALRRQLGRAGSHPGGETALLLRSTILGIVARPLAVSQVGGGRFRARQHQLLVQVEFALEKQGRRLWHRRLQESESYLSAPDLRGGGANRLVALERVLERLVKLLCEELEAWPGRQ